MLLIASESLRGTRAIADVVREMSLTLSYFGSAATFGELLHGESRRIVLLAEQDLTKDIITCLQNAEGRVPFAVIVAGSRSYLSNTGNAELVDAMLELGHLEWIGRKFDTFRLADSARRSRRRMLRISRDHLERAFTDFEYVVRYQPKVQRAAAGEWQTREAEALVRWRHPEHGLVGPLEFLPEIEAFGMMDRLTEFVLRKTAAQLLQWRDQGLMLNGCVNLAPSLLARGSLADELAAVVREFGLDCSRFTFEVVEQDLADPGAPHLQSLIALREHGFRICLDDFRVAARSLGMFEKLPFDEIKIHASALRRAQQDDVALHVLAAVTGLAHNLGMSVCAAGIEDRETFEFMKTIECDKMQGFLISEAVLPHIIRKVYSTIADDKDEAVA